VDQRVDHFGDVVPHGGAEEDRGFVGLKLVVGLQPGDCVVANCRASVSEFPIPDAIR
jgi:hypothetical protein